MGHGQLLAPAKASKISISVSVFAPLPLRWPCPPNDLVPVAVSAFNLSIRIPSTSSQFRICQRTRAESIPPRSRALLHSTFTPAPRQKPDPCQTRFPSARIPQRESATCSCLTLVPAVDCVQNIFRTLPNFAYTLSQSRLAPSPVHYPARTQILSPTSDD